MIERNEISKRAYIVFLVLCLFAVAVVVKVFWIQTFPSERALQIAQNFTYKVNSIEPQRGQIFSSDGHLLATSIPDYEIRWDSKSQYDRAVYSAKIDSLAMCLSKLFGNKTSADYKGLFRKAKSEGDRYAKIVEHVDYNKLQEFKKLPFARLGKFKSGFVIVENSKRIKPFGALAARTIGLEREDNKVGLELAYDSLLSGKKGEQLQEKIAGGIWKPMTDDYIVVPEPGCDIVSTIDVHLQDVAHAALKRQLEQHSAQWGCAILMEVETGYVRAIANLSKNEKSGAYEESLNLAISQSIEPGSTFKLASLMACLDEGLVQLEDSVDTGNGEMYIDGRKLSDSNKDKGGNGKLSAEQVFEKSSNIGTALLIKKAFEKNPQKFLDKLNGFGLQESLKINLAGEGKPQLYSTTDKKKGWSKLSLTQLSIGYETLLTPLQLLAFYNAVANNGKLVKPQFVQSIIKKGKETDRTKPEILRKNFCSNSTLDKCKQMMRGVMEEGGTADWVFKNSPYTVAGKTGTAWLNEGSGYLLNRYRASFVGYFPAEQPKYSCIVVIHDPRSGVYYGSAVAAPVFKELADKIYSTQLEFHEPVVLLDSASKANCRIPVAKSGYNEPLTLVYEGLGIPVTKISDGEWVSVTSGKDTVTVNEKKMVKGLVPGVVGMGLQDALYLLENSGLKVQVFGYGTVKRQSITPGASVRANPFITIELS